MEKSYAERLYESARDTCIQLKTDYKKIYNWVSNDFSGFLNKIDNPNYSFLYRGKILSDEFVQEIANILVEVGFQNERYNKKELKEKIEQYLNTLERTDEEIPKNIKIFFDWNEIQVEFMFKLNKFIYESSVSNNS